MRFKLILALLLLTACASPVELDLLEVPLNNGETFSLTADEQSGRIEGIPVNFYAYNQHIPGPVLRVKQGSNITVNFQNNLGAATTVHWHGLRLDNQFDGVPDVTQEPVEPGASFTYQLTFPDAGFYWYHPHIREDLQQEAGLYGGIIVEADDALIDDAVLFLDDALVTSSGFNFRSVANFAMSGRMGNKLFINGKPSETIESGKNLRLYLVNTANARPFKFSIEGVSLKLIGGDIGWYETPVDVSQIILAPGERAIIEVSFPKAGTYRMLHTPPLRKIQVGEIIVSDEETAVDSPTQLIDVDVAQFLDAEPDYVIELTGETMMGQHTHPGSLTDGIEWDDPMPHMNERSTSTNTRWILRDRETGKENDELVYEVKLGDYKKIKFYNSPDSDHQMQHPMHLHGQRFLVLSVDGIENKDLVWKDTVLVPVNQEVEILVEFSNPGDWVFHCHIAEHLESGMMGMFKVV